MSRLKLNGIFLYNNHPSTRPGSVFLFLLFFVIFSPNHFKQPISNPTFLQIAYSNNPKPNFPGWGSKPQNFGFEIKLTIELHCFHNSLSILYKVLHHDADADRTRQNSNRITIPYKTLSKDAEDANRVIIGQFSIFLWYEILEKLVTYTLFYK